MKFIPLIWSNLRRKKARTLLTLLSIVVAFILFGFLSAIKQALLGGVEMAGVSRLVVRHKVSLIQLLPESYKARMERIPGVAAATHQTWFGGLYRDSKVRFMQNPVVPEEFLDMHPEFILPPEQKKACTPDVYRLCAGEIPNARAITACLRRQKASLSPACAAVFEQ